MGEWKWFFSFETARAPPDNNIVFLVNGYYLPNHVQSIRRRTTKQYICIWVFF